MTVIPNRTNGTDADATDPLGALVDRHNYTDCCRASNVSAGCLGFCTLRNILDGSTNQEPERCEDEFPAIVKCMAGNCALNTFASARAFNVGASQTAGTTCRAAPRRAFPTSAKTSAAASTRSRRTTSRRTSPALPTRNDRWRA